MDSQKMKNHGLTPMVSSNSRVPRVRLKSEPSSSTDLRPRSYERIIKYYIFRHGETFVTKGDKPNYGLRVFSADILEEGKPALKKMGRYLKKVSTDFNVSSRFKRCRQTVEIISKNSNKQFVFDFRLNEVFFELPFMFKNRVRDFLNSIKEKDYQEVLICTHAAVINELIRNINPQAFLTLSRKKSDPRPPLQTEITRQKFPTNQLSFSKYLSPGVLLIITENSVQEVNFNSPT